MLSILIYSSGTKWETTAPFPPHTFSRPLQIFYPSVPLFSSFLKNENKRCCGLKLFSRAVYTLNQPCLTWPGSNCHSVEICACQGHVLRTNLVQVFLLNKQTTVIIFRCEVCERFECRHQRRRELQYYSASDKEPLIARKYFMETSESLQSSAKEDLVR